MRVFLAAVVGVATSVALAGSAAAGTNAGGGRQSPRQAAVTLPWSGLSVGVNDDSGKSALRDWVYPVMSDEGLRLNTLTLTWDESEPLKILGRAELAVAVAAAQENGIATELDLYPLHSQAFTHGNRCKPSADPEGHRARYDGAAHAASPIRRAHDRSRRGRAPARPEGQDAGEDHDPNGGAE